MIKYFDNRRDQVPGAIATVGDYDGRALLAVDENYDIWLSNRINKDQATIELFDALMRLMPPKPYKILEMHMKLMQAYVALIGVIEDPNFKQISAENQTKILSNLEQVKYMFST